VDKPPVAPGIREKGRLVVPPQIKHKAIRLLKKLGITRESLGLKNADAVDKADEIATGIREEFEREFPPKNSTTLCKGDA